MSTEVKKLRKDEYNTEERVIVPPVDIYENENEYVIRAEMPGVDKKDIDVTLKDRELEIKGSLNGNAPDEKSLKYSEFRLYDYYRKFKVGDDINNTALTAKLENGLLTLTLPKSEEVKPRKIEIDVTN